MSFPSEEADPETRRKWIAALPNDPASLPKQIWACATHFEGEWVKTRGGKRPLNPPSIFPGVPKSCLKQIQSKERCTKASSAETRRESQEATNEARDKIINFKNVLKEIKRYFPLFSFVNDGADLTLFRTDKMGREIVVFIHFREVVSPFSVFLNLSPLNAMEWRFLNNS